MTVVVVMVVAVCTVSTDLMRGTTTMAHIRT